MNDDNQSESEDSEPVSQQKAVESALEDAQGELASAQADLAALESEREATKAEREQLEQRVDLLREAVRHLEELMQAFREEANQRITTVESNRSALESRLANARAALEAYWSASPHARQCGAWLSWKPPPHAPITPAELGQRFNLSVADMTGIITHELHADRRLRERLLGHQQEWKAARGPVEKAVAERKLQSVFAGEAGERIVRAALSPLAENFSSSVRKNLSGNGATKFTKVDGTYEGLRVPLVLGRGEGMAAPERGSFANEVKWGRAEYIWDQRDHMATQAEGHQHYDTSVTLCSRNFHDLSEDRQQALRNTLRSAHSPLLVILPRKEELDQACMDVMTRYTVPEVEVP
jgi:hypothetical protein